MTLRSLSALVLLLHSLLSAAQRKFADDAGVKVLGKSPRGRAVTVGTT